VQSVSRSDSRSVGQPWLEIFSPIYTSPLRFLFWFFLLRLKPTYLPRWITTPPSPHTIGQPLRQETYSRTAKTGLTSSTICSLLRVALTIINQARWVEERSRSKPSKMTGIALCKQPASLPPSPHVSFHCQFHSLYTLMPSLFDVLWREGMRCDAIQCDA